MKLLNLQKPVDLTGYTLLIPSVSVGNVPQLTIDLLITTLKFEAIASIWHPGIVASVGADPFYSNNKVLCTACELYVNKTLKLAAIQFRSTIETKLMLKFLSDLVDCIVEQKFSKVYILGTGFDYELHNIANKNTFYFVTNGENSERISELTNSKLLERTGNGKLVVSGSGFAVKLYEAIGNCVNSILLIKYVSEGENIHDSKGFLIKLFEFLDLKEESAKPLSFPTSWHYIYGAPPPVGLF